MQNPLKKTKLINEKYLQRRIIFIALSSLAACATPYVETENIDYSYQQHSLSPKVLYESHYDKRTLKFIGGSAKDLVENIVNNGYFLVFADSNHYEIGIRQKALDLAAHTKLKRIGIELPQDASPSSRTAYNKQFSYLPNLQPVMIDVTEKKHLQFTQHPSYKYAYGAINHLIYKNILDTRRTNKNDIECEFIKYRMVESDVKIAKNTINQQLNAMIFGISHFTYRLDGQLAGIDNHLEKAGRKVKTIAIASANQEEYKKLKIRFPDGDLMFTNGLSDIDYTMIIPAKTQVVDKLGSFYKFYDQQGEIIDLSTSSTNPPPCSGLVPSILVRL